MKILFVENHSRFASITTKTFLSDHTVTVVPSVAAALQAWSKDSFEVVLIGYDLDDGKGVEVVKEMEAQSARPIIIATSSHG